MKVEELISIIKEELDSLNKISCFNAQLQLNKADIKARLLETLSKLLIL